MLDFVTIGGATRDIFFKVDGAAKKRAKKVLEKDSLVLPYGEKLVSEETFYAYGGGSVNSSICLSRLGQKVASVCNIGAEGTGSLVLSALRCEKVNTSNVIRDPKHHTGLSIFVLGDDNEHTGFLERGANSHLKFSPRKLKSTKWFYISSLTGDSAKMLPVIFDYAKRKNIKIAFNPGSEQIALGSRKLGRYIEQADILNVNIDEAEQLLGDKKKKYKNKRNLLLALSDLGAKITVITDGECGSHAAVDGKVYSQPAMPKDVLDTTGAGDSFGATFAFGIASGHDVRYSLKIASINSASVVSKMGAQDGLMSYNSIKRSPWL